MLIETIIPFSAMPKQHTPATSNTSKFSLNILISTSLFIFSKNQTVQNMILIWIQLRILTSCTSGALYDKDILLMVTKIKI